MDKNGLAVAAVVVSMLALVVAIVALLSTPEAPPDRSQDVTALQAKLDETLAAVASLKASGSGSLGAVRDLSARVDKVEEKVVALADYPAPAAAAAPVDREMVRDLMREEMRAQMERMRDNMRRQPQDEATALKERAGLTPEKTEKVLALRKELSDGIRNIWRENKGGDREANMKLMNELRQNTEKQMAEFLTAEELAKVKETERGPRWGRGRGNRGGPPGRGRDLGDRENRENQDNRRAPPEETPAF